MIRSVRANKATFRTVKFEPGFNVVLADKTDQLQPVHLRHVDVGEDEIVPA